MGQMVKYAIGAFVQSLGQNPGIEKLLQDLGPQAHIYVGTGLGDLATSFSVSQAYARAQRRWNRFWCHEEHNPRLAEFRADGLRQTGSELRLELGVPEDPARLQRRRRFLR